MKQLTKKKINKKMKIGIVLLMILVTVPGSMAIPTHLANFTIKYPFTNGTRIDSCDLCHIPGLIPSIVNRNPYGFDFGNQTLHFTDPNQSFANIEGNDSDGDGFTNIQEIISLTFPGNALDSPVAIVQNITLTVDNATKTTVTNTLAIYNLTINNTGNVVDTFFFIISNPPNNETLAALSTPFITLNPNTSGTVLFVVTSATPGNVIINVTAKSVANATVNATVSTNTTVLPTLLSVGLPSVLFTPVNFNATYFLTVTNIENVTDTFNLAIQNPQNATTAILNKSTITLSPNASGTILLNVTNATTGSFIVNVTAISATNATINTTVSTNTTVVTFFAVVLGADAGTKSAFVNTNATYNITVENLQGIAETFNLTVQNPQAATIAVLNVSVITLNPRSSGTVMLNVTNNVPGTFVVNVTATSITNAGINNTVPLLALFLPVVVQVVNGVSIAADNPAKSTVVNTSVAYILTVKNLQNLTEIFNLTVQNPQNVSSAILNMTSITLAANASGVAMLNMTNTIPGTFVVNVTAISATNTTINGSIMTTTTVLAFGDVNNLPGLDVGDVLFIAQFVAGVRIPTALQTIVGDTNKDGVLDVGDVLFTAQTLAGLRTL